MQVMKLSTVLALVLAALMIATASTAGSYDGSKTMLCATSLAVECGDDYDCKNVAPAVSQIPEFFHVNVKKKQLRAAWGDKDEKSAIGRVEHQYDQLILQGIENGRAWSMMISEETGRMSITVSDSQVGFVLFGACILR
jgi:hypothetical protein